MARGKTAGKSTKKAEKKREIGAYTHEDKTRAYNPPVGLVTPDTDKDSDKKTYAYDPHLDPSLVWAGKAEHTSFEVPTVSLHVHERIDPKTIIQAVKKTVRPIIFVLVKLNGFTDRARFVGPVK